MGFSPSLQILMRYLLERHIYGLQLSGSTNTFSPCLCFEICYVQLPDYHEIIEQPMDFGTVRKKLDGGNYLNLEELEVGR